MSAKAINVISAVELSLENRAELETKLKQKFGSDNIFNYLIDATLIAGFIIQVGDMEYHYDLHDQIDFILNELLK